MEIFNVQFVPLLVAAVAGVVSLLGLVISKETRVSEFRQSWIDALRADIASLIARVNAVNDKQWAPQTNPDERVNRILSDLLNMDEAVARIQLRLKPGGCRERNVLAAAHKMARLAKPDRRTSRDRLTRAEKRLVEASAVLLKHEWERVKRGEPVYRWSKGTAIVFVAAAVFGFLILIADVSIGLWPSNPDEPSAPDTGLVVPHRQDMAVDDPT